MNIVYLLSGSNIGDPLKFLKEAEINIGEKVGHIIRKSHVYRTAAWGKRDQPDFYNQVLIVETLSNAKSVLNTILDIEKKMGRKRTIKNGPRTIDIDILFFNQDIIDEPDLKVPHPLMQERKFVLEPLHELSPNFIHPYLKKTISELLDICEDKLNVERI